MAARGSAGDPLVVTGSLSSTSPAEVAPGAAVPAKGLFVVGTDGTFAQGLKLDSAGRLELASGGAPGSAIPSRAQMVGGSDGTNLRSLKVNTDGSQVVDTELPAAALAADGLALPTTPQILALNGLYNGSTVDLERGNMPVTALMALAARTTTQVAPGGILTNYGARFLIAYLNITVASGTGGLFLKVYGEDTVSGGRALLLNPSGQITTGLKAYIVGPTAAAVAGGVVATYNGVVPRSFSFDVGVSDSSSYTYQLSYALIR